MPYVRGKDRLGTSLATTAALSVGANAIIPGSGAIVGAAASLFGGLFGGSSQADQQRIARVAYFYNLAVGGNVGAAQVMLGAIPDVAADEQGYWQTALQNLSKSNVQCYNAALTAGGVRFTGQGDTATNYPHMQAYALNWAANNAPVGTAAAISTPTTTTGRITSLPVMTTTAPYNWMPVALGVAAAAAGALLLSKPSRH